MVHTGCRHWHHPLAAFRVHFHVAAAPHPGRRWCLPLPLPAAGAEATDLLRKFLRFNPEDRITIDEVSGGGHVMQWPPPASNHHQRGGGGADGLSSAS